MKSGFGFSMPTSHLVNGFPNGITISIKTIDFDPQMVFISKEELLGIFFSIQTKKWIINKIEITSRLIFSALNWSQGAKVKMYANSKNWTNIQL